MKLVGVIILTILLMLVGVGCFNEQPTSSGITRADSVEIIQTVLNDPKLVREAKQSFGRQPLKIVRYRIIQKDYNLTFAGQMVEIVPEEYLNQISENTSKRVIATVPMLRAVTTDTVRLSMVFYPGQATFLYTLTKDKNSWQIKGREYGKL